MKTLQMILLMVFLLCLSSACQQQADEVERIMEDGVEVVISSLRPYQVEGELNNLSLEEDFIIDLERPDLAWIGIENVMGFDVDSKGSIYIWSYLASRDLVFKFDSEGKYLFSFGQRGQGPGELGTIFALRINEKDEIIISDPDKRKLIVCNTSGEFNKTIPIGFNHSMATLIESEKILAMKPHYSQEKDVIEELTIISNVDSSDIKILTQGRMSPNWMNANKLNAVELYGERFPWSITNKFIYIGNADVGYEFLQYDTKGQLLKKIKKKYRHVRFSKHYKLSVANMFMNHPANKRSGVFSNIMDKVYFPDYLPPFQFFFSDELGRLFVMTYERGKKPGDFRYDIFNPEGYFIGRTSLGNSGNEITAPWGGPFEVRAKNNRLYCLREKESGYKELVVYKMKWK